jgi:hypothetical protein
MTARGVGGSICLNPLPTPRLGLARMRTFWPTHGTGVERPQINKIISNSISILQLNFKHILELLSMVTSADLCLCTQLAMSISPKDLNFEMNLSNVLEIVTYPWPKKNNVVDDQ